MTSPPELDTERTLHVRCGSDIRQTLGAAGFKGKFLEFADPFCQGPVSVLPQRDFVIARASFVSEAYRLDADATITRMRKEYESLDSVVEHERIVLWFEHDPYDQLILAYLMCRFSGCREELPLEMICVDAVPGVPDFIGLGQLAPEMLRWLWRYQRKPVTRGQLDLGRGVWEAYTTPDPVRLRDFARDTPDIPPMANALKRQLQELPWVGSGLGMTQQLALEILAEYGSLPGRRLFHILMTEKEPIPFLGDLMFWHVLADMNRTSQPLFETQADVEAARWPDKVLTITDTGKAVLAGAVDYLDLYKSRRWVGAIPVTGDHAPPRWDSKNDAVISP